MYPRYEQYQDSGVAWLGDVPSHWEVKRLKFAIHYISDKTEAQFSDLRYFGLENIQSFTGKLLDEIELTSEGITHLFQKNDVLFGKLRPYLAKVYLAEQNGLVSTEALVFRSKENIQPKFLFYYCLSPEFIDAVNGTTFGSKMPRASWDDIGNFKIILPPLPEQTAIAAFLDCKLAQIDALISKQETLLAKLAEKRTALITHAVTRGLNPAAPLKPSGVAWLDEVPQHWEVIQFKRIVESVKDGTHGTYSRVSDGYPLLSAKNVFNHGLEIGKNESLITESDFQQITSNGFPRKNDLLITCVGSIGRCCVYEFDKPMAFQRSVAFLRLESKANPYFYRYFVLSSSYQEQLKANIKLSIQGGVYLNTLTSLIVYLPPLAEQTAIAHYLDTQTAQIDALSDKIRQTIARLQEYRRTLITQAVTGKIKVIGEHR